jgi:hypothetical protein
VHGKTEGLGEPCQNGVFPAIRACLVLKKPLRHSLQTTQATWGTGSTTGGTFSNTGGGTQSHKPRFSTDARSTSPKAASTATRNMCVPTLRMC